MKVRPNEHERQNPFHNETDGNLGLNFIDPTDLEWMSINYRKVRAAKLSESKRRMILIMFQKDLKYFPSLREIRDELI